jgi:phenylpyruvate tautomerase PptA (4-oxalocrotonate tautomerase family)
MPVYTCVTTTKTLADDTKAALAAEITKIHSSVTGAPTSFVHVVFQELPATNVFTDSSPSEPPADNRRHPRRARRRGQGASRQGHLLE